MNKYLQVQKNDNLENIEWLFENKFPYDETVFENIVKNGNIESIKWLLENKFPYNKYTNEKLKEYETYGLKNIKN